MAQTKKDPTAAEGTAKKATKATAKKTTKATAEKATKATKAAAKKPTKSTAKAPAVEEVAEVETVVEEPVAAVDDTATSAEAEAEVSEEEAERNIERLRAAFSALDDDTVRAIVASLTESNRGELADQLQLPRATMHLGTALPGLLRRKLRVATPARLLQAAFTLTEAVNDDAVHALGSNHEDPSRDDLLEVLPGVIEEYGAPLVTAFLAAYSASDAPSRAVCADLLDTDERFVVGEPVPDAAATPAAGGAPKLTKAEQAAVEAKREERKAAKAARREAAQHERAAREAAHAARRAAQRRAKRS